MGFLMALFYDRVQRKAERQSLGGWRRELLSTATGSVLELGSGTGVNLPLYPHAQIDRLVASEPDRHMRRRLERRVAESDQDVELSDAPADRLPFGDDSFDCMVSTLVLCSVPDLGEALREARRVLRPGGTLLFIEHVAADDDPGLLRWQRRLEPLWKWCAEGCCLTRRTEQAIRDAGFEIEELVHDQMLPTPAFVRGVIRGRARLPA